MTNNAQCRAEISWIGKRGIRRPTTKMDRLKLRATVDADRFQLEQLELYGGDLS